MKVKYDTDNKKAFQIFNDSMGVALNKNNIIKSKKVKYINYLAYEVICLIIATIFLGMALLLTFTYFSYLSIIISLIATASFIYIVLSAAYPLLFMQSFKITNETLLEINEKGLTYYFDSDEYITLGWTHIRALVYGKYSLNFITDEFYYFYLDKSKRKEILEAIKKYNDSLVIIK